ncbi:MAG: acetate--CoA ligase family protein, partial [Acetobacteraceae bacterium]|nr:acetate--CoA ligase family protein [Acetobacteraceae bacterium]
VMANARRAAPEAMIKGVLVQPMVRNGTEVLLGGRIDPLFGPLVVVVIGRALVELLADRVVALAPVTHGEAKAMLLALRGSALLQGFRGSEPVDLDDLAEVVVRVGTFLEDHADRVEELDINPVICRGGEILAVDALIQLR